MRGVAIIETHTALESLEAIAAMAGVHAGAGRVEDQTAVVEPTRYTFAGRTLFIEYADREPSSLAFEQLLDHPGSRTVRALAKRQFIAVAEQAVSTAAMRLGVEAGGCGELAHKSPFEDKILAGATQNKRTVGKARNRSNR